MNTTSKWGGYGASFFNLVCFAEGMAYAIKEGDLPTWFAIVTGSTFCLAAISGAVCLTAAFISHFRQKRHGNQLLGGGEVKEKTA